MPPFARFVQGRISDRVYRATRVLPAPFGDNGYMRALYLASVYLHILAAIIWIGGMFFVMLVVVPWLRAGGRANAAALLHETGTRFRTVGWVCFVVLLLTGTFNLWVRGVGPADLIDPDWLGSPFGTAVVLKLAIFAFVIPVSAFHDFVVGPQATVAMHQDPQSPATQRLRRQASYLGRANALLALVILGVAVVLVRGWP
jgi:uncharacterized membrane protein